MNDYMALNFSIESIRGVRISSNFRLHPTHCKVTIISEEDKTILAAANSLNYVNSDFNGDEKLQHKQIIQQLTQIVANGPPQRVAARPPQRVTTPPTSVDITAPETIRTTPRIHQQRTRSKTPMPSII